MRSGGVGDEYWYVYSSLFYSFPFLYNNTYRESTPLNSPPSHLIHRKGARGPDGFKGRLSIRHKRHRVLIEPITGRRSSFKSALSITLSTGLNPDNIVDVRVTGVGSGAHTESNYFRS